MASGNGTWTLARRLEHAKTTGATSHAACVAAGASIANGYGQRVLTTENIALNAKLLAPLLSRAR